VPPLKGLTWLSQLVARLPWSDSQPLRQTMANKASQRIGILPGKVVREAMLIGVRHRFQQRDFAGG